MNLPFFYAPGLSQHTITPDLEEETMRHMVQVLRLKTGDQLKLTDGKGVVATASMATVSKKTCTVAIQNTTIIPPPFHQVTIAISPLKNPSRFEWFLEKAAELGISRIVPLICSRTEKQHIKKERWINILSSAMIQSQQSWLTELPDGVSFQKLIEEPVKTQKYIAHCMPGEKADLQNLVKKEHHSSIILIGPEGDFTATEIDMAIARQFVPVSLGQTRLRTESAGVTAAVLLTHPAGQGG